MKEFLNKLKTPTKILSIVCFVLVIMLFSKCSSVNELKGKNHYLQIELTKMDSINKVNETTIRFLNDSIKDLNFKSAVDKGYTMEGKHDAEIKLAKCEKDNLRLANEKDNLRRESANQKIKIKKLESESANLKIKIKKLESE